MYKCVASNKVGRDERLVYFYVTSEYEETKEVNYSPMVNLLLKKSIHKWPDFEGLQSFKRHTTHATTVFNFKFWIEYWSKHSGISI